MLHAARRYIVTNVETVTSHASEYRDEDADRNRIVIYTHLLGDSRRCASEADRKSNRVDRQDG